VLKTPHDPLDVLFLDIEYDLHASILAREASGPGADRRGRPDPWASDSTLGSASPGTGILRAAQKWTIRGQNNRQT